MFDMGVGLTFFLVDDGVVGAYLWLIAPTECAHPVQYANPAHTVPFIDVGVSPLP